MTPSLIRTILADDHAIIRDGLRILLDAQPDIEVVGVAADGREAVRLIGELHPDIAVLDIGMPGLNGIDATRQILETSPQTRVVILSMHATSEYIYNAIQAGASGYLLKDSASLEVAEALRAVHAGGRYLSEHISETLVDDYFRLRESVPEQSPLERLSLREREVLQLVVEGRSSADIGELLSLSPKSVESYRSRLMKKLGVEDMPALVKFAIRHGLTPLD